MKRTLNKEEQQIIRKQLGRLEQEREYQLYLEHHANLMLEQGLYQNYQKSIREFQQKLKTVKKQQNELQQTIQTLNDQLQNGVETKEEQ